MHPTPLRLLTPLALAFAVLCGPASAASVTVTISNFAFVPAETTIAAGDTVNFVNSDDTIHSLVADEGMFHSAGLDTDGSFSVKFPQAGTFAFHCGLHPYMVGKVIVK